MEKLKSLDEFTKPDKRNQGLAKKTKDGFLPLIFEVCYKDVEGIILFPFVPDEIRSYLEMIKNIYIHGWYYYPLYTLAGFLSLFAIEMALRERFKKEDPQRKKSFRSLLEKAVEKDLIKANKFSHVRERWETSKKMEQETGGLIKAFPETEEYCRALAETIPSLRNAFAHPSMTTLFLPGQAASMIKLSSELINQLFEDPDNEED